MPLPRWLKTPLGLAATVGCVLAIVGFLLGYTLRVPLDALHDTEQHSVTGLATVEDRALTQDTTIGGNVRRGKTIDITLQATDGEQVVTRVEVSQGDVVKSGQMLALVSGRPVIAVRTEFPLYRDLAVGDSGDDAQELNSMLSNLGKASAGSDTFTQATGNGIAQLYADYGLTAPSSGQGEVNEAQDAYDEARTDSETDEVQLQALREQLDTAKAESGTRFRLSDFYFLPAGEPTVEAISAKGAVLDSEDSVLGTLRSGKNVVTARVDLSKADTYQTGADVTVSTTDGEGTEAAFTVGEVSDFKEGDDGDGQTPPGYDVTFEAVDAFPDEFEDDAAVSITAENADADRSTAIPLVGLREDPDGNYVLIPGADEKCRVSTGEQAAGWIGITSDCVAVGDQIVVGP